MDAAAERFSITSEAVNKLLRESGMSRADQLVSLTANIGAMLCAGTGGEFNQELADDVADMTVESYLRACEFYNQHSTLN